MRSTRRHQNARQRHRSADAEMRGDERAVQQERRDHEEDRHADVEAREVAAGTRGAHRARRRRDVQHDDRERGQRAQAVEPREPGRRLRARSRSGRRGHGATFDAGCAAVPAPEQRTVLAAQERALDEVPARGRDDDRHRERGQQVLEERPVRQRVARPSAPLVHLLDEGLVPQVDRRTRSCRGTRSAAAAGTGA